MFRRFFRSSKADQPLQESPFPRPQEVVGERYRLQSNLQSHRSDNYYLGTAPDQSLHYLWVQPYQDEETEAFIQGQFQAARALDGQTSFAPFTDFGSSTKGIWLARRFREGPTAEEVLRGAPHPPELVSKWMDSLLRALAMLELYGLLFQEWQPDKILLTEGCAVLCDIGHQPYRNKVVCNPHSLPIPDYMAPEAIAGAQKSPLADRYSVGALTYHLLTGEPPHQGSGPLEVLIGILSTPAPSLQETRPDLPAELACVVDHLLHKDPEERARYSLSELLEMLGGKKLETHNPGQQISSGQMTDFLQLARSEGRKEDSGVFTLEPLRALEKLSKFQFLLPHHFLVALAAAGPGLQAKRLEITSGPDLLELNFHCAPRSAQELQTLLLAACAGSRGNPFCHLGYGVVGALGAGCQEVEVISGEHAATFRSLGSPILKRGKFEGVRIVMKGSLVGEVPPPDILERLLLYPMPVSWNGTNVRLSTPEEMDRVELTPDCWLQSFEQEKPGFYLRVLGLSFRVPVSFPLFGRLILLEGPWKLDASYSGIQRDERRHELERMAGDWVLESTVKERLNTPVDLSRPRLYATLLKQELNEETRDALHYAIVAAAYREESESTDPPGALRGPRQLLIEESCAYLLRKRAPGLKTSNPDPAAPP